MNNRIKNNNSRKKSVKRERIIMLVSSAFVMAALTMTGIYMKEVSEKEQEDGYSVDLAELENNVEDKYQELVEGVENKVEVAESSVADNTAQGLENTETDTSLANNTDTAKSPILDEELDYMPRPDSVIDELPITAVDSGLVEIPGLTDVAEQEMLEDETVTETAHTFSEEEGLIPPVTGEVLMHYNMDNTVYFATLDQYKYNPAVIFQAGEGSDVLACADAKVAELYSNEEVGSALVLELGDGYYVTYGQLAAIYVNVGDHVSANQVIATVAQPTKYYVVEGSNLYFAMEKDGQAVNPETFLP